MTRIATVLRSRFVVAGIALALACAVAPTSGARAPDAGDRCFLWELRSESATVYLLGSIHVARRDFYPLPRAIEDAFARSDALAVELDTSKLDAKMLKDLTLKHGTYGPRDSLANHVSKSTLRRFRAHCAAKGLERGPLEKLRPWLLSSTLVTTELKDLGNRPNLGLDRHFIQRARGGDGRASKSSRRQTKPILELESAESQMKLLADLPDDVQELLLIQSLAGMKAVKRTAGDLTRAWRAGDVEAVEKLLGADPLLDNPKTRPVFEKLYGERNARMAEKVAEFLEGNRTVFVVVGAAHVVGDRGIVRLLEEKGFEVRQVTTKAPPARRRRTTTAPTDRHS